MYVCSGHYGRQRNNYVRLMVEQNRFRTTHKTRVRELSAVPSQTASYNGVPDKGSKKK